MSRCASVIGILYTVIVEIIDITVMFLNFRTDRSEQTV